MHHLIPRSAKRDYNIRRNNGLIPVCKFCHHFLHKTFNNYTLAMNLNTVDDIIKHPKFNDFLNDKYTENAVHVIENRQKSIFVSP